MSEISPAVRRCRLSLSAFLVLWGGWSFSAWLCMTLWLGDGLFREANLNRSLALVQIVVTWLGLGYWEFSLRRRHLSPHALRPWLAWFVFVPLTLSALFLLYAPKVHRRLPGSYLNNTEFTYLAQDPGQQPPITPEKFKTERDEKEPMPMIVLQMRSRKSNWGITQRSVRFGPCNLYLHGQEDVGPVWIIDRKGKTAHRRGQRASERNLDEDGRRYVLSDLAGAYYTGKQLEVIARSINDYLDNRGPLPPRLRIIPGILDEKLIHRIRVEAGVIPRPWRWLTAVLFTGLMFPVTWLTVHRTMFPPAQGPDGSAPPPPGNAAKPST